jgi:hypothetical protein
MLLCSGYDSVKVLTIVPEEAVMVTIEAESASRDSVSTLEAVRVPIEVMRTPIETL